MYVLYITSVMPETFFLLFIINQEIYSAHFNNFLFGKLDLHTCWHSLPTPGIYNRNKFKKKSGLIFFFVINRYSNKVTIEINVVIFKNKGIVSIPNS